MPTPKKPLVLRELHGTANRNKHRTPESTPVPERGIGEAPAHLSDDEKLVWDEINDFVYAGVLASGDRLTLELICKLITESRKDFVNFQSSRLAQLNSLLSKCGLTPSDRSKVSIPKPKAANPFENM